MVYKSLWLKGLKEKKEQELTEDSKVDILIIGGGITGLSTAYNLRKSNMKVMLIEGDRIGSDSTGKSTGKITYLQGYLYDKIKKIHGEKTCLEYLESQKYACKLIRDIIVENNIKCNYESNIGYLFTNKSSEKNKVKYISELVNAQEKDTLPIKYSYKYGIKLNDTAVFNPLQYLYGLKKICTDSKIIIHENTKALNIEKTDDGYVCFTNQAKIKAKKVILACHYPAFMENLFLPFQTEIQKSYIVAGITDKNKMFNAIDINDNNSIRYYSDKLEYILLCDGSKRLSQNIDNASSYDKIIWKMRTKLTSNIKYAWFNSDLFTNDFLPIIGYVEDNNNSLLVGTGYNGYGLTNGSLAGKILSDLVLEKDNKYTSLFQLNRKTTINRIFNLIAYNFNNSRTYTLSKLKTNYSFYPKNVYVYEKDSVKYGVYIDDNNKKHIVKNICPHMKCNLIFNTVDKTWDCPCHASRFNIDGKVIKGPAIYSIKVEKK